MVTVLFRCSKYKLNRSILQPCPQLLTQKFLHESKKQQKELSIRKQIYKREDVKKMRMGILQRYVDYVRNIDKVIEKKFPTALHLYRTFKGGLREFLSDLKLYISIIRRINSPTGGFKSLTLQEIELYHRMPTDMLKISPVLLFTVLPLTNYVIFPLSYYFPRQLLCRHFWTLQQRSEFEMYYLKLRLQYNRSTFRCMQEELSCLKNKSPHFKHWSRTLGCIGSGIQPTTEEILDCIELFKCGPYHLDCLKPAHVKNLLKIHGMSTSIWFRRTRLKDRARLLQAMDNAILREKSVAALPQESLRYACFIRGLNPVYMRYDDMVCWLKQWLEISQQVDKDSASLLLHCPILLAYNQPSNWRLIYK